MHNAKTIAEYIIIREKELGRNVTPFRLQQLLYFSQANCLKSLKRPCFNNKIHAWDLGTVVEDVEYKYKIFGGAIIPPQKIKPNINAPIANVVNKTIEEAAKYTSMEMAKLSMSQDPWIRARKNLKREIPLIYMVEYFIKKKGNENNGYNKKEKC